MNKIKFCLFTEGECPITWLFLSLTLWVANLSPSVKRVSIHVKTKASYKRTVLCWELMSSEELEWERHFIPIMCLGNSPYNSPYPNTQMRQARHLILKCKLIVKISGQLRDISSLKETKTANTEENPSFCHLPSETSENVTLLGPSLGFLKFTMQIFSWIFIS